MLSFISFGSGSSGNCYYLFTATDGLLIDAGVGARGLKKHFKDHGLSLAKVKHILITHDHTDHVKSVGSLSHDYNLPVYATAQVHQGIARNYCVHRKISPELAVTIEKGVKFSAGEFDITPFAVPHDSADNVGYSITHGNKTLCIITDAGHVTDEMRQHIAQADYLIIEANHDEEMLRNGNYPQHLKKRIAGDHGHLSNKDCATALAENATERLSHVWLCHLSAENNHPELARKTVETILAAHGIPPGKQFTLEVLRRTTPGDVCLLEDDALGS